MKKGKMTIAIKVGTETKNFGITCWMRWSVIPIL